MIQQDFDTFKVAFDDLPQSSQHSKWKMEVCPKGSDNEQVIKISGINRDFTERKFKKTDHLKYLKHQFFWFDI